MHAGGCSLGAHLPIADVDRLVGLCFNVFLTKAVGVRAPVPQCRLFSPERLGFGPDASKDVTGPVRVQPRVPADPCHTWGDGASRGRSPDPPPPRRWLHAAGSLCRRLPPLSKRQDEEAASPGGPARGLRGAPKESSRRRGVREEDGEPAGDPQCLRHGKRDPRESERARVCARKRGLFPGRSLAPSPVLPQHASLQHFPRPLAVRRLPSTKRAPCPVHPPFRPFRQVGGPSVLKVQAQHSGRFVTPGIRLSCLSSGARWDTEIGQLRGGGVPLLPQQFGGLNAVDCFP